MFICNFEITFLDFYPVMSIYEGLDGGGGGGGGGLVFTIH